MRKRVIARKGKMTNETIKEPVSKEAQEIADALKPIIPIEQVIYLNDDKRVEHEQGTNRYYVNYPESWRTVPNQHLILGVRSIRKYESKERLFSLTIAIKFYDSKKVLVERKEMTYAQIYTNEDLLPENQEKFINGFLDAWNTFYATLSDKERFVEQKLSKKGNLRYDMQPNLLLNSELVGVTKISCNVYMRNNTTDIHTFKWTNPHNPSRSCEGFSITFSPYMFHDFEKTYLLSASFVSLTNYYYLGFTNTEFMPPKQYEIPSGESRFWIDVNSPDGLTPMELNPDGRDLVAIELQLSTVPHSRYM